MDKGLKKIIISELKKRKYNGMAQYEMETLFNFSKSHISETLSEMISKNIIIKKNCGKLIKKIWLKAYYPGHIENYIRIGILKSSEYVKFLSAAFSVADSLNLNIQVISFNNTVDMMNAMENNALEISLSPAVSQIIYAITKDNYFIIGPVASGGSCIFSNDKFDSDQIKTSDISSMMLLSRNFMMLNKYNNISFYKNPKTGMLDFLKFKFRYIAIWEPFASFIECKGRKREKDYHDLLDDRPCCLISAGKEFYSKNNQILESIMNAYKSNENIDGRAVKIISRETSIDYDNVIKSLHRYNYSIKFGIDQLKDYANSMGILLSEEKIKKIFKMM
ncbi:MULTISPECIES: hypothetical protein [Acidiplasma]|nr:MULTISPECIES: hypothetical protein [Acidiplasma]